MPSRWLTEIAAVAFKWRWSKRLRFDITRFRVAVRDLRGNRPCSDLWTWLENDYEPFEADLKQLARFRADEYVTSGPRDARGYWRKARVIEIAVNEDADLILDRLNACHMAD